MEMAKKNDLSVLMFYGRANMALGGCEAGSRRKNATHVIRKEAAGVY